MVQKNQPELKEHQKENKNMITITKDYIYKSDFSITDLKTTANLEIIQEDEILSYLSDYVELGESVTFDRIFELISLNKDLIENIFYSCLGGYSLSPFINEIENIPTEKSQLDYVEIGWYCDRYDNEFNISSSFHGIGSEKDGKEMTYAIEFTPLNNLKSLPIRLNTNLSYFILPKKGNGKHKDVYLGNRYFTLYDILYGILFEITFNGDPKNRNMRFSELQVSIDEAEEQLKNDEFITNDDLESLFTDEYTVKHGEFIDRIEPELLNELSDLPALKNCLLEKLKIYSEIEKTNKKDLTSFDNRLTNVEFNLQILYGVDEDINFHRFWETPKCTCPKIDNTLKYPFGDYEIDANCPIHKNRKVEH